MSSTTNTSRNDTASTLSAVDSSTEFWFPEIPTMNYILKGMCVGFLGISFSIFMRIIYTSGFTNPSLLASFFTFFLFSIVMYWLHHEAKGDYKKTILDYENQTLEMHKRRFKMQNSADLSSLRDSMVQANKYREELRVTSFAFSAVEVVEVIRLRDEAQRKEEVANAIASLNACTLKLIDLSKHCCSSFYWNAEQHEILVANLNSFQASCGMTVEADSHSSLIPPPTISC